MNCLEVEVAGLKFRNPVLLAAGILGMTAESLIRVAEAGAGGLVTKSVGLKPRKGFPNPTVVQVNCGLINAMGLPNPGIKTFSEEIREVKRRVKVPLIVSVYGYSAEEFAETAELAVEAGADAVELNVSCPHVEGTGGEIGQNPELLKEVVSKVKRRISKPVFVKLSPNVTDIAYLAEIAVKAGADAITAINTVRAMKIDIKTGRPILANRIGGLSGPAIKPIAVRCVYEIYERIRVPIFGCGGISNWRDAIEFILAGASAVQIGTAIALRGLEVFRAISKGIEAYIKKKGFRSVREIVGLSHNL
ncbi:dihydroorotate dehydrogenase [Candidatus Bathyarchaeota archaeon]|nr:dihydroorotate dehydrogenase [Candidatus Bathyarchaeota archaeon]